MTCFDKLPAAIRATAPSLPPADVSGWAATLTPPMIMRGINSIRAVAAFVGQCSVETGWTEMVEDMSYSAAGLVATWPERFPTIAAAAPYARNPLKLGNHVYANRMGNGSEATGDGYQFRGRGLEQTTGREDYTRLAKAMGMSLADLLPWMETRAGAAAAACWDWQQLGCGPLAEAWEITALSRRINGGDIGLEERLAACNAALKAMGVAAPAAPATRVAPKSPPPAPDAGDSADALMAAELAALNTGE